MRIIVGHYYIYPLNILLVLAGIAIAAGLLIRLTGKRSGFAAERISAQDTANTRKQKLRPDTHPKKRQSRFSGSAGKKKNSAFQKGRPVTDWEQQTLERLLLKAAQQASSAEYRQTLEKLRNFLSDIPCWDKNAVLQNDPEAIMLLNAVVFAEVKNHLMDGDYPIMLLCMMDGMNGGIESFQCPETGWMETTIEEADLDNPAMLADDRRVVTVWNSSCNRIVERVYNKVLDCLPADDLSLMPVLRGLSGAELQDSLEELSVLSDYKDLSERSVEIIGAILAWRIDEALKDPHVRCLSPSSLSWIRSLASLLGEIGFDILLQECENYTMH